MAFARRIQNPEGLNFITFATVQFPTKTAAKNKFQLPV